MTHARTHTHGANYNLPPVSQAGNKKNSKFNKFAVISDLLNGELSR